MSSSHLLFSLPTALYALAPMLRPGFHFAAFFVNLVSGCEAILTSSLHIGSPHLFFSFFRASFYVFDPISFFNAVSMSSSVSSMKETSLSWSQSVFELLPSSVSPSDFWLSSLSFFRLLAPHHSSSLFLPCFSSFSPCIFALFVQ